MTYWILFKITKKRGAETHISVPQLPEGVKTMYVQNNLQNSMAKENPFLKE